MANTRSSGFTLIELVITIVVVGILAAATLPYITAGAFPVSKSVDTLKDSFLLKSVMENMIADFKYHHDPHEALQELHESKLKDFRYGIGLNEGDDYRYIVKVNQFVRYENGSEKASGVDIENCDGLRVTLVSQDSQEIQLTYLFSEF